MAQEAMAATAPAEGGADDGEQGNSRSNMMRFVFQALMVWTVMQFIGRGQKQKQAMEVSPAGGGVATVNAGRGGMQMKNLYGPLEECELFVHLSTPMMELESASAPYRPSLPLDAVRNETLGWEHGLHLLWHQKVFYEADAQIESVNITMPALPAEVLSGERPAPYILATLLRVSDGLDVPKDQILQQSLPITARWRELHTGSDTGNLFGDDDHDGPVKPKKNLSAPKLLYLKSKLEFRPVFDQTVHTISSIQQGPFKKLRGFPEQGFYQPFLYLSDFWGLERDYTPLNMTLEGQPLNLTLSYSVISALSWSLQTQMAEQWSVQGEWGLTDTQRDSFMFKRLYLDTNPYLLAFSGAFLMLHTVFSMLAFKNDIQFWRKNESMQGLSARSMVVSFVCQAITTLYLLDSQETSRLILFNICLDTALSTWKLRKAVKLEVDLSFPFVHFSGQTGYENNNTSKYDDQAVRYMVAILFPLFIGYSLRSAVYGKHRGWYSFLVGSAAGGVYTFGFIMMTPQLYINYKLQSVEHLPWRALTYKAMNTFVDDIAALLIDMPMMHRLSCFRDDIIFFVYIYQRWVYAVDKKRPSMWVRPEELPDGAAPAAVADGDGSTSTAAVTEAASEDTAASAGECPESSAGKAGGAGKAARKRK